MFRSKLLNHPAVVRLGRSVKGRPLKIGASRIEAALSSYAAATVPRRKSESLARAPRPSTSQAVASTLGSADAPEEPKDWEINLGRGDSAWLVKAKASGRFFTGPAPQEAHGCGPDGILRSVPAPRLGAGVRGRREEAKKYFDNTWALTEALFAGLESEVPYYCPPVHGLRHPLIFYYGHPACLYVNKFRAAGLLDGPVNAYFESIFEVGVDEMSWDDMHKNEMLWPSVREVHEYRQQVYEAVCKVIAEHPGLEDDAMGGKAIGWEDPLWALYMGLEHERIHLETSSVLFRELPFELVKKPHGWPTPHPSAYRPEAKAKAEAFPEQGVDYPANAMVTVAGGVARIGKAKDESGSGDFGWDNEYGLREVAVGGFSASKLLVSNGEFAQFVQAGGYATERFWSEDGWGWRAHRGLDMPFFWRTSNDGPGFKLRTVFEEVDMPWDWPVDVTYHEAKAFAKWKSELAGVAGTAGAYRLVTEAEHHLLRHPPSLESDPEALTDAKKANLNLAHGSQCPVDAMEPSPSGHHDTMGNAWEWTEDHFNPLPGFEVHSVYDDFSTPCFDGRHHMIMGGSFASTGDEASVYARFHFRPHFLQHSSFRLVANPTGRVPATLLATSEADALEVARAAEEQALRQAEARGWASPAKSLREEADNAKRNFSSSAASVNLAGTSFQDGQGSTYETQELLDMYLGLHYGQAFQGDQGVPALIPHEGAPAHALGFPQRCAQLLTRLAQKEGSADKAKLGRALDVGCAVGGASFELAKHFDEVVGFDYSRSFVDAAKSMRDLPVEPPLEACPTYRVPTEGALVSTSRAAHSPGVDAAAKARTHFLEGDACELVAGGELADLRGFDAALLANLLCRLPDPRRCLDGLALALNPGGVALLVSPYSWLEAFTPRDKWIGGYADPETGEARRSREVLGEEMHKRGFELVHEEQMAGLIKEHQRKYQYIVSEATAWRKIAK